MSFSDVIEHAEKIGIGTYQIAGLAGMLNGVNALHANWFYTWGGQLPAFDYTGWSIGSAASRAGTVTDQALQLDSGPNAWASQDFIIGGRQAVTLSFEANGISGSLGGVVVSYLSASGGTIGTSYQAVEAGSQSYVLNGITPSGTTSAQLVAYTASGQGVAFDDISVRVSARELIQNGSFEQTAPLPSGVEEGFIPMAWGSTDMSNLAQIASSPIKELLTFNEPDHHDQANMTVSQALGNWPALIATGKRLGSPATTTGNTLGENSWLGKFMSGADAAGYRVDFVAVHYYTTDPSVEAFRSFLENVHAAYDRPVWVTEWSLADWSNQDRFTAEQQKDFFAAGTQMMDDLAFVERQSWFSAYEGLDSLNLNSGLLNIDGSLTTVGASFADLAGSNYQSGITLYGSDGRDVLYGGDGRDMLSGGAGDDRLYGGLGVDRLYGGEGTDTLKGEAGADWMEGGNGNDRYAVDNTSDQVIELAGGGSDTVTATASFTLVGETETLTFSGSGDYTGIGSNTANKVTGSIGNDMLSGMGGADRLYGGIGNDVLNGGDGLDLLEGGDGNDTLYGGVDNDTLKGGAGADWIEGGDGNDSLIGGIGVDRLQGGNGNDSYTVDDTSDRVIELAGGGSDTVTSSVSFTLVGEIERLSFTGSGDYTGIGSDTTNKIIGSVGNDLLQAMAGDDRLYGGLGNDTLDGGDGLDILYGDAGDDRLYSGAGNDLLDGGDGRDMLFGGADDNRLYGGTGNDTLDGGDGRDMLYGGAGIDIFTGGAGADRFVLGSLADVSGGTEIIKDFSNVQGDRIDLSAIDANGNALGNQAFKFIGTAGFTAAAGELHYAKVDNIWRVEGDINGDRIADFTISLWNLPGASVLTSSAFIL